MKNIIKLILFIPIFLGACEKYEASQANYLKTNGVFVICEGNYSYSTATLSFYDPTTKQAENNIYEKTNNIPMGDVAQSMVITDSTGFIIINNSQKIIIINTNTFKQLSSITGFTSPRYIQFINSEKAYVSDLYNTAITIFNPKTYKITGIIPLGKTTEQMVKFGDKVFATNWSGENSIQRIDCTTDKLVDALDVKRQPNSMVLDKNNKLWVLSDGGYQDEQGKQIASLTKIDAASFIVEKVFDFPSLKYSPSRLTINGTKDTIYYLSGGWEKTAGVNNGIFQMAVSNTELPAQPIINQNNKLFYALGIDPVNSQIYVSDALDYVQSGVIYRYSAQAVPIDTFKAGVIPSYFCFKKQY